MSVTNKINSNPKAVKPDRGLIEKELGERGAQTPLRLWLYWDKHISGWDPVVTPELWDEWLTVKESYIAEIEAKNASRRAKYEAQQKAEDDAKRETARREAAARQVRTAKAAKLQAYVFKPIELEPVDYEKLHALKKHPEKSKRRLAVRWAEQFESLPEAVQTAWRAFHSAATVTVGLMSNDVSSEPDDDADDFGSTNASLQWVYLNELPPGKRDLHEGIVLEVLAGLRDPAYHRFRRFNEGVRRLIELIGNPLDSTILPSPDRYRPEPAQDLDDIADDAEKLRHIVPGLLPRGWTIPHGDASAGKSLFLQKLALVVADKNDATFEGIEVDHGQVIYATLDPQASREEVKPGLIEIRALLGLQPSGRLCLTDAPLILNEPSSVEHWIELNRARVPCKLIVVDSLFSAAAGSLAQDIVVKGVCDGVKRLLRHADAVVTIHHDNKSGDIFGSVYTTAMLGGKMAVTRNTLKDGRPGGHVTVVVERLKRPEPGRRDVPEVKLAYRLDGPFLVRENATDAADADAMPIRRPDILKELQTVATPIAAARKLIEHMLTGKTRKSRDGEWSRLREHWAKRERVAVNEDTGTIRRVA